MKFETLNEILERYKKEPVYYDANLKLSMLYQVQNPNAKFSFEQDETKTLEFIISDIKISVTAYGLPEAEKTQAELDALKIYEQRHKKLKELQGWYENIGNENLKDAYASMCANRASSGEVVKIIKSIKPKDLEIENNFFYLCVDFASQYAPHIADLILGVVQSKIEEGVQFRQKEAEKREAERLKAEKKEAKRQEKLAKRKDDSDEGPEDEIK